MMDTAESADKANSLEAFMRTLKNAVDVVQAAHVFAAERSGAEQELAALKSETEAFRAASAAEKVLLGQDIAGVQAQADKERVVLAELKKETASIRSDARAKAAEKIAEAQAKAADLIAEAKEKLTAVNVEIQAAEQARTDALNAKKAAEAELLAVRESLAAIRNQAAQLAGR